MIDRRRTSSIKDEDMVDIKDRLIRIEELGTEAHIATKVMESSFATHATQNERDFEHTDQCLHRFELESKSRDDAIIQKIDGILEDVQELKKFMWKVSGALLILVPLVNFVAEKIL